MIEAVEELKPEIAEARRNTAQNNLGVFGIDLPGNLTDEMVERIERIRPGFTTMKIVCESLLGIRIISPSKKEKKKIKKILKS